MPGRSARSAIPNRSAGRSAIYRTYRSTYAGHGARSAIPAEVRDGVLFIGPTRPQDVVPEARRICSSILEVVSFLLHSL